MRNGQRLKVTFEEHNGSLASLVGLDGSVTTDPTTTVQTRTAQADALGAAFPGYAPTSATIAAQMTTLESATTLTSSEITAAFRTMNAAVDNNLALPSLATTAAHDAVVALLAVRVSLQSYYARFAPNVSSVRYYLLPAEMSVAEIAQTVYGDISRVSLLYAANSFVDPLMVPAGTLVTVLPT